MDTGKALGKPLKGHKGEIYDVAVGKRSDGTPVAISSGLDKTIRARSLGA